jgi:hypothetical protein
LSQQQKHFWKIAAKKSAVTLFVWTPLITICIAGFISLTADSFDEVKRVFIICLTFSYAISFFVCLFSLMMWGVFVRGGEHLVTKMQGRIWPHFAYSLLSLRPGLWVAEHFLYRMIDRPFSDLAGFGQQIAIGVIVSLVMIFFFGYIETRKHAIELERASAVSNFNLLRTQMQPHFLFNSLNSLAALIDLDPSRAGTMTQQLADLYRGILEASKAPTIPLSRELEISRSYLLIEKTRLGQRLDFVIHDVKSFSELQIPSLLIQTLVENAVKHGISPHLNGGKIEISVKPTEGSFVAIEVENTGASLQKEVIFGTGLQNTMSRLTALFGKNTHFDLVRSDNKTIARVQIPLENVHAEF